MPKAPTNARQRKAAAEPASEGTVPGVDPSKWRKSTIRATTTITMTKAKDQYHLNDADLAKLNHEIEYRPVAYKPMTVKTKVFNKREVERAAWEKHGGPDGFAAYLKKLQENRAKRARAKSAAAQPAARDGNTSTPVHAPLPVPALTLAPAPMPVPAVPSVFAPPLARGPLRDGRSWVLDACNAALDWHDRLHANPYEGNVAMYASACARRLPMQAALRFKETYPASRPTAVLSPTPAVSALRAVLAVAPRLPKEQAYAYAKPLNVPGITAKCHSWPEEEFTYEWGTPYLDRLLRALGGVIIERGTGEAGWLTARWEVYDTCVECIGGITYEGKRGWMDQAAHWLDGAYPLHDSKNIAFALSSRSKSHLGAWYNNLLPYQTPADVPHVGWV